VTGDAHPSQEATADVPAGVRRTLELDSAAAEALAVVTLYASGRAADAELASRLLDQVAIDRQGAARVIGGLVSTCAALLALHEYQTGVQPHEALREVGRLVAQAAYAP